MEVKQYSKQKRFLKFAFLIAFVCTAGFIVYSTSYIYPLQSGDIVSFEMAKTQENALAIMNEWKAAGKFEKGIESITGDYIFIVLYTLSIMLGCRLFSLLTKSDILIKYGIAFSYIILIGACSDVIENITMTRTLTHEINSETIFLTYIMAGIKFTTVIICLIFSMACLTIWLAGKFQKSAAAKRN